MVGAVVGGVISGKREGGGVVSGFVAAAYC